MTLSGSQVALEPETTVRRQVVLEGLTVAVQGATLEVMEGTVALVEVRKLHLFRFTLRLSLKCDS